MGKRWPVAFGAGAPEHEVAALFAWAVGVARVRARRLACSDLEEAEGVGLLALVEAARRYTYDRGATLKTFARRRIEGAVVDHHRQRFGGRHNVQEFTAFVPVDERMPDPRQQRSLEVVPELVALGRALGGMSPEDRSVALVDVTGLTLDEVKGGVGLTRSGTCRRRQAVVAELRAAVA